MFVRVSAYEVACYSLAAHARTWCAVMRCATHLYLYQQSYTKYHTREKRYKEIILNWTHWHLLIFFFLMGDTQHLIFTTIEIQFSSHFLSLNKNRLLNCV